MQYEELELKFVSRHGAEKSTMMGKPCLRYNGEFIAMMFARENALIVKIPEQRVNELISQKRGREFNFTKKRFKQWLLIPQDQKSEYEKYV